MSNVIIGIMNKIILPARLSKGQDGKVHVKGDNQLFQMYFEQLLKNEVSVEVEMSFQPLNSKKTNQQLRYFFGVVLPIIKGKFEEDTGESYTIDEVTSFLKSEFCYHEVWNPIEGKNDKVLCSLSTLSKKDCADFITKCINFAHDKLDIIVPEPLDYDSNNKVI